MCICHQTCCQSVLYRHTSLCRHKTTDLYVFLHVVHGVGTWLSLRTHLQCLILTLSPGGIGPDLVLDAKSLVMSFFMLKLIKQLSGSGFVVLDLGSWSSLVLALFVTGSGLWS